MAVNVVQPTALTTLSITNTFEHKTQKPGIYVGYSSNYKKNPVRTLSIRKGSSLVFACLSPPPPPSSSISSSSSKPSSSLSIRLYVSGLSFRTTEESLRNAFKNFGELMEVNLVIDKIANRPRGFAFLRYATEEESQKAIEGMHGKFLDGRVIFVEVAKPRSELRQRYKQNPR
ncbi:hypothetical protein L6164_021416 [Bauhinia variegata]|uniref:Uncharacterized protein n=1 Tax=Bauhinia variegata TaxID=167791 RepID=A0ACB9N241_BAUVA|nr:hypothetical protein L6164_021416 [Bauhinia variegata]